MKNGAWSLVFQEFAVVVEAEKTEKTSEEQRIIKDLNTMSKKEKLKLLKKESPELLELIQDFKAKVWLWKIVVIAEISFAVI